MPIPGRAGALVLAAVAPVTMLVADPAGWYPFGPSKWLAVSALLLLGSALVVRSRAVVVERSLAVALVVLVGWLAVAAAVGLDPLYAWIGTPERHFGVLTWALCALALVVGRSLEAQEGDTILTGIVVAGLGVGAVATAEALGWEPDLLDVAGRLSGSFGSPAYLGAASGPPAPHRGRGGDRRDVRTPAPVGRGLRRRIAHRGLPRLGCPRLLAGVGGVCPGRHLDVAARCLVAGPGPPGAARPRPSWVWPPCSSPSSRSRPSEGGCRR